LQFKLHSDVTHRHTLVGADSLVAIFICRVGQGA
jgi:hypothetical protein